MNSIITAMGQDGLSVERQDGATSARPVPPSSSEFNFQLRDKPQRPGRNPKTGEAIPISARRVVTFHASHKLKSQIDLAADPS
jgi:hypothetical protein